MQTSWAVVRVSGGCAPPASQFVNASAGPTEGLLAHLLHQLCLGWSPGCGLAGTSLSMGGHRR